MTLASAPRPSGTWLARVLGSSLMPALAALLAGATLAQPAGATPEYPSVIDNTFDTECPLLTRCLICHTSSRGGQSTAVQPFAETLRMYGLSRGRDPAGLQNALARLPDITDSDEDGVPDKEELLNCGNPSGEELGGGPQYGCDGAHLAPAPEQESAPLGLLALIAAAVIIQRRRPSPTAR